MSPADVERVVEAYSKLLETLDDGTFLKLESLLPYPKSKIRECLETARRFVGAVPDQFVDQEVSAMREALDVGLITLARFVPDSEVPPLRDNTVDAVLERARQGTLGAGAIRALATVVAAKAFSGSSAESTELR